MAVVQNYTHLRSGLPDLLLLRASTPETVKLLAEAVATHICPEHPSFHHSLDTMHDQVSKLELEVSFVEVKGPRDTLAAHQTHWLTLLTKTGCQVEMCLVREKSL